jgi:hypothetical protein
VYFGTRKGQFGLESAIIIIGIIIAIIAIVNATLAWSDVLETSFVRLITDMPVFEYDVINGEETGNENFELYMLLRNISFYIFLAAMFVAGVSFMLEHVNLVPPETAINIISKSVFYIIFFFIFPALWDLSATMVEESSLWILNPEDPQNPIQKVEFIFSKLGAIETPEVSFDSIVSGIGDPVGVFEGFFLNVFLAAFKAIALIIFIFLVFIIGTIRMVFTAVLIIGLPVILTLSLIPWFFGITKKLLEALTGLLIAPIIAAIVIVAGSAYLGTIETSAELEQGAIQQWFSALAVMALAVFIPVILVPMLGSLVSTMTTLTTGAVSSGAMLTGMAGMGGVRGGFGALRGFAGAQFGTTHPSWLEMVKAGFSRPGMAAFVKGSGTGSLEGLGAGSAVAAGTTLGAVPGGDHSIGHTLGRMGSHMMQDVGAQEVQMGIRMGENLIVNNKHRNLENDLLGFENQLKLDPIGNMENIETGQLILNDPKSRELFLNNVHERVVGFDTMSEEMKKKLDDGTLQIMQQHAAAFGKMTEKMKLFVDKGYKESHTDTKMS